MAGPTIGDDGIARCPWAVGENLAYHDEEWGRPVHGEAAVFERLTLEAFQSGLSWLIILRKRPAFRVSFDGFDVETVASYDDARLASLLENAGIVRNRLKIEATRTNARAAVALREDGGLEDFIASYRPEQTPAPETTDQVPTTSPESLALSKALKKKGFTFVGPTTMHALMEATGLVDTHLVGCHRRGIGGVWA